MPAASRNYSSTAGLMRLVGGITGAAASLIVDTVTGLPTVPFTLMLDPGEATEEIVEVTAAGGTTLTVTRGVDGTSAQAHLNGKEVRHAYSARDFQDSRNHEANTTTAHGATGAVVGTTDIQTLTNKDLTAGTNAFPTTLATLTGAQTLTNKTIVGTSNTLSAIPSAAVTGLDTHTAAVAAHGAAVAVVGTTETQALTNKTIDGSLNTFTNVPLSALSGGAWTAYTPTLAGMALGNGTLTCAYTMTGKNLGLRIQVTFGSTTAITGNVSISLPPGMTTVAVQQNLLATVYAATAGALFYGMFNVLGGVTTGFIYQPTSSTNTFMVKLGSVGLNMGAGSSLIVNGTLEVV